MKKSILLFAGFTVALILVSFNSKPLVEEDQIKIKISSATPISFDLFNNSKISRDLKTPYEITVSKADRNLIFKSNESKSPVKVEVVSGKGIIVMGEWPVVVLQFQDGTISTFGL